MGLDEPAELVESWNTHPSNRRTVEPVERGRERIQECGRFSRPSPPVAGRGYYAVAQNIEGNHG